MVENFLLLGIFATQKIKQKKIQVFKHHEKENEKIAGQLEV